MSYFNSAINLIKSIITQKQRGEKVFVQECICRAEVTLFVEVIFHDLIKYQLSKDDHYHVKAHS